MLLDIFFKKLKKKAPPQYICLFEGIKSRNYPIFFSIFFLKNDFLCIKYFF